MQPWRSSDTKSLYQSTWDDFCSNETINGRLSRGWMVWDISFLNIVPHFPLPLSLVLVPYANIYFCVSLPSNLYYSGNMFQHLPQFINAQKFALKRSLALSFSHQPRGKGDTKAYTAVGWLEPLPILSQAHSKKYRILFIMMKFVGLRASLRWTLLYPL